MNTLKFLLTGSVMELDRWNNGYYRLPRCKDGEMLAEGGREGRCGERHFMGEQDEGHG